MSNVNVKKVQEFAKAGDSNKIIRAKLTLEGLSDKEISAVIKEAGIGRNTAGFTQTNTLAFLESGVSEKQLYSKLIEEKAKNELRWISDRNRIRITLNRVIENLGGKVKEEAATEAQKKEAAEIVKGK